MWWSSLATEVYILENTYIYQQCGTWRTFSELSVGMVLITDSRKLFTVWCRAREWCFRQDHRCASERGRWSWSSLRCLSESLSSERRYSQWPWPGHGKTGDPVSPSRRPMACLPLSWAKAHGSCYIFLSGFSIDGLISNSFYGNLPV